VTAWTVSEGPLESSIVRRVKLSCMIPRKDEPSPTTCSSIVHFDPGNMELD